MKVGFFTLLARSLAGKTPTLLDELWEHLINNILTPEYKTYTNIDVSSDSLVTVPMIFFGGLVALLVFVSVGIFTKRVLGRLVRRLIKNNASTPDSAMTLAELGLEDRKAIRLFLNRYSLSRAVRCREEDEYYGVEYVPEANTDYYPEKKDSDAEETSSDGEEERSDKAPLENEEAETSESCDDTCAAERRISDAFAISQATPRSARYRRDPDKDHFYVAEKQRYRMARRYDTKGTNPMMILFTAVIYVVLGLLFIKVLPHLLTVIDGAISAAKSVGR